MLNTEFPWQFPWTEFLWQFYLWHSPCVCLRVILLCHWGTTWSMRHQHALPSYSCLHRLVFCLSTPRLDRLHVHVYMGTEWSTEPGQGHSTYRTVQILNWFWPSTLQQNLSYRYVDMLHVCPCLSGFRFVPYTNTDLGLTVGCLQRQAHVRSLNRKQAWCLWVL